MTDETSNQSSIDGGEDPELQSGTNEEWSADLNLAISLYFALLQSLSPEDKFKMVTVARLIGHAVLVSEGLGPPRPPRP